MRLLIAISALCLGLSSATAQVRPDSLTMTCQSVGALVSSRGAAIIGTGGQTYERYVRSRDFCGGSQNTRAGFVQTRDAAACFVGYLCEDFAQCNR